MFVKFALFLCFAVVVLARPDEPVPIVRQENVVEPDGKYHYSFETGDGTSAQQTGENKQVGGTPEEAGISAQGDFAYTDPEGNKIQVQYVADENGYQPTGDHIPQIPEAIVKALKWIEEHPSAESKA